MDQLRTPAETSTRRVHNLKMLIQALEQNAIQPTDHQGTPITPKHIVDGDARRTLELLWTLLAEFRAPSLLDPRELRAEAARIGNASGIPASPLPASEQESCEDEALLFWCKAVCAKRNIRVSNFTNSFADGRALCAIINFYHPELLEWDEVQSTTREFVSTPTRVREYNETVSEPTFVLIDDMSI